VQEGEDPQRTGGCDELEIGHAATQQRVSRPEVVPDVQAGHHPGEASTRFVHAEELGHDVAQGLGAIVGTHERDLRHRGAQHTGGDRVSLGMVGIQQAVRSCEVDDLRQLPAEIHGVLDTDVEALPTHRGVNVRRVAGQQDPPRAVGSGLTGHVGEPRDPGGIVDSEVGPVDGDEALAHVAQRGLAGFHPRFGQRDADRSARLVDDSAVADLVFDLADGVLARGGAADAQLRLLGHLGLGDEAARRRIPAGKLDPGGPADEAATSVAPDEIVRAQVPAVGQMDVDSGIVLGEADHITPAVERHRQLPDPPRQDALDAVLPQAEAVVMARGEVADVQADAGKPRNLRRLSLREKALRDSTLVEDLDGARMQAARARAGKVLARAPLDDGHVDARQRQLGAQHQPGRAASNDHHLMPGHCRPLNASVIIGCFPSHEPHLGGRL